MRPVDQFQSATMSIAAARDAVAAAGQSAAIVHHGGNVALVMPAMLDAAIARGEGDAPLASLLPVPTDVSPQAALERPHVHLDQSLSLALQRMGEAQRPILPVVGRADVRRILGAITLDDTLAEYGVSGAEARGGSRSG